MVQPGIGLKRTRPTPPAQLVSKIYFEISVTPVRNVLRGAYSNSIAWLAGCKGLAQNVSFLAFSPKVNADWYGIKLVPWMQEMLSRGP